MAFKFNKDKKSTATELCERLRTKAQNHINATEALNDDRCEGVKLLTEALEMADDFDGVLKEPFEINDIQRITALSVGKNGLDLTIETKSKDKKGAWVAKTKPAKFMEAEEFSYLLINGKIPDGKKTVSVMDFMDAFAKYKDEN